MEEFVYLNGKILPRSQAGVPVYDHGFLYGYAVFETMRAYQGVIFRLNDHLERLIDGAKLIGINIGTVQSDLPGACLATLKANGLTNARLRLTVSRGEVESFPGRSGDGTPTVLATARAYTPLPEEAYRRGFRAGVSSFRVNSQSRIANIKSANYLLSLLARMEAESAGLNEALLLNERALITEGSTSNVFLVREGRVITPTLESGILPGITRAVVIELAGRLGISVEQRGVTLAEARQFQEAFLTNSVIELMPLVQIITGDESIDYGAPQPDSITVKLMSAYREEVRVETGAS